MNTAAATTPGAATIELTSDELQFLRQGLSAMYLQSVDDGQQAVWRRLAAKLDDAALALAGEIRS